MEGFGVEEFKVYYVAGVRFEAVGRFRVIGFGWGFKACWREL